MRWNGASHFEFDGTLMETETTTWSEFPNGGKDIVEKTLASEERSKCKRTGMWKSVWDVSSNVNHQSKVVPLEKVSQALWWTLKMGCLREPHLC